MRRALSTWTGGAAVVFRKELRDAIRDRRTLLVVLASSVLLGPLVLIAISAFVATFEARAERREVLVKGIEHAPTLANWFARQSVRVEAPPAEYEAGLRNGRLGDPVLVVPDDFEAALARAEAPVLVLVSDSANTQAEAGTARLGALLQGFNRERATLHLAMRGVSPALLQDVQVQPRDLASAQTRGTQVTGMLPFFVLMAVVYGALGAALDTTAGERERGSLEPLLANPAHRVAVVLGKWGAVAVLAMGVALASCASFLPAQWLLRSDRLAALFRYGTQEAALFLVVLMPFAAALSAVLMAVAIRCRSVKEAQASSAVVVLAMSLLPLVSLLNQRGEQPWQLWIPGLAQQLLMTRVLRGDGFTPEQAFVPLFVCIVLAAAGVAAVARTLRHAALG